MFRGSFHNASLTCIDIGEGGPPLNRALRWLLAIWTIVYLVVACGPLLLTDSGLLQGIGLVTGLILLVPWLVGVVVLAVLVWLTNPPPREP